MMNLNGFQICQPSGQADGLPSGGHGLHGAWVGDVAIREQGLEAEVEARRKGHGEVDRASEGPPHWAGNGRAGTVGQVKFLAIYVAML